MTKGWELGWIQLTHSIQELTGAEILRTEALFLNQTTSALCCLLIQSLVPWTFWFFSKFFQSFLGDLPIWVRHTQIPIFTIKRKGWDGSRASGIQDRKLIALRYRGESSEPGKIAQKREIEGIIKYLPDLMKRWGEDGDYRKSGLPMTWHRNEVSEQRSTMPKLECLDH